MATTSPSTTVPAGRSASASTIYGNCPFRDFLRRENSVTPVPDLTARARYPSSLISHSHSNPSGSFDTDRHSIGSTNDASVLGNESKCLRISPIKRSGPLVRIQAARLLIEPFHVGFPLLYFAQKRI